LAAGMERMPQVLLNVEVEQRFDPAEVPAILAVQRRIEAYLAGEGRVVLRASGTEPVIRVMVEGRDEADVRGCANELAQAVRSAVPRRSAPV
ncbi:MAG: phosphoglucosamine mutase, partial [Steroidobacteraceae bacterium]